MKITLLAVRNGEVKITVPDVDVSEFPHRGNNWFTSRSACEKEGIDPKASGFNTKAPTASTAHLYLRMGLNPCGVELVSESDYSARRAAELERDCPGVASMRALRSQSISEADRASRDFDRMMSDEYNDGVNPPLAENLSYAQNLAALRDANPRAWLYLKAEIQSEGTTSYSATSGAMTAGKNAMKIIRGGGSIEEAQTALAFRYASDF